MKTRFEGCEMSSMADRTGRSERYLSVAHILCVAGDIACVKATGSAAVAVPRVMLDRKPE
jgi:hypothetical protein